MTNINVDVKTVLTQSLSVLELANTIFNSSKYSESADSYHPKTKILVPATLKLQQELRKHLFNKTFSSLEIKIVLEFFNHKSKLDKKDQYLVKSYYRATDAAEIYKMIWKFQLKNIDILENESQEIQSPS